MLVQICSGDGPTLHQTIDTKELIARKAHRRTFDDFRASSFAAGYRRMWCQSELSCHARPFRDDETYCLLTAPFGRSRSDWEIQCRTPPDPPLPDWTAHSGN